MSKPTEEQIIELEEAIRAQENLRDSLGDAVVNATIAALREKLEGLQASEGEERKLVTCLFCDLVGSTQMAATRDPEEVLRIIDGALETMGEAVEAYGGNIARYMGDGVLAFFGAPKALENHAEQAILAGLDIQRRLADYAHTLQERNELDELLARVGINSGYVVAGNVAGAKGEYTVIGDTINIASRIEQEAPAGGVLVGEATYRLAGGDAQFDAESWGEISIKGQTDPLVVYEIQQRTDASAYRAKAVARAALTGRSKELTDLKDEYRHTVEKRSAKLVAIIGEAGIGKTRLRIEFASWVNEIEPETPIWLGRAFSFSKHTPYALASSILRSRLEIRESDDATTRRQKLERGWSSAGGLAAEDLHGLATILALDYPESTIANLEPHSKRNAIFDAFSNFFTSYADRAPMVLIIEDAQWADEVSIDLVEYLLQSALKMPLFGVILARPPESAPSEGKAFTSRVGVGPYLEIRLRYLTPEETAEMIGSLLSSSSVPSSIVESVAQATQGNPFFIEEILNALIADGTLQAQNGDWKVTGPETELHVPETVQGVLAARIDRLEPDLKSVLQHAAIIGRTFWQELLADLIQQPVDERLNRLSDQEFVLRRGRDTVVQDWEWIFRHVLVQEVAYDSVLKQLRRAAHHRIAEWLESHGTDRLQELAPLLAHHFREGEAWEKAVEYQLQAAERSRDLFAVSEALASADRAMDLVAHYPDAVGRELGLRAHELRGEVRALAGEFDGALEDYELVLSEARKAQDTAKEQALLVKVGMVYRRADDYENAMANLSEALAVARSRGDEHGAADALYHLGSVAWSEGDNVRSTEYHEEALQITRTLRLNDIVAVQAYHGRAEAYWLSGLPQKSIEMFNKSLTLAIQIGDKSYESENHQMLGLMYTGAFGVADYAKSREHAERSRAINDQAHLHWHEGPALYTMTLALLGSGDYQQAADYALRGEALAREIGALRLLSIGLDFEAQAYEQINLHERAKNRYKKGLEVAQEIGAGFHEAPLRAGLAISRLRQGDLDVESQLREALDQATQRDQTVFATRALKGLAEFSIATGDPEAALSYADQLYAIASAGSMLELIARAHLWRGKALVAMGSATDSEESLGIALRLAEQDLSPRLMWDIHSAYAGLYGFRGNEKLKMQHEEAVKRIVTEIAEKISDPKLRSGLPNF